MRHRRLNRRRQHGRKRKRPRRSAEGSAAINDPKNGFDRFPQEEISAMDRYCEEYKHFLDAGKTEREARMRCRLAEAQGFRPFVPDRS